MSDYDALLDVVGLALRRQVRTWSSWRTWLATASLLLPVCAVVSPAYSVAAIAGQTDLQILCLAFWGGVGTLLLAWAAGFTLGYITRYGTLSVLVVLTTMAILSSLDEIRKATPWQAILVALLVVIPSAYGLMRGFRGATLQPRSAIGLGMLGALSAGFIIAGPGVALDVRWSDCVVLAAIWPVLYAIICSSIPSPNRAGCEDVAEVFE